MNVAQNTSATMPNVLDDIAHRLSEQIEASRSPLLGQGLAAQGLLPVNFTNNRPFFGINALVLGGAGFDDPRWMTVEQALKSRLERIEGATPTPVLSWQKHSQDATRRRLFVAHVYNAEQLIGIPKFEPTVEKRHELSDDVPERLSRVRDGGPTESTTAGADKIAAACAAYIVSGHFRLPSPANGLDPNELKQFLRDPATIMRSASQGHRFANALLGEKGLLALPKRDVRSSRSPATLVYTSAPSPITSVNPSSSFSTDLPFEQESAVTMNVDVKAQFREALEAFGLVIEGEPVMDGTMQRVPVRRSDNRKPGNRDGAYVGHLDGRPAGWMKNYFTMEETKWKSNHQISDAERRKIMAEAAANRAQADKIRKARYQHHARRAALFISLLPTPAPDHPYLVKKGISASPGIYQDRKGNLVIPFGDTSGVIKGFQRIGGGGFKQIKKGTQKSGAFHVVGGDIKALNGEQIVITEGYATGVSVNNATGIPVIVAFDAHNLQSVAKDIRTAFPEAAIVIAGDDDQHKKINVGREQALKAKSISQAEVVFPTEVVKGPHGDDFNDQMKQGHRESVRILVMAAIDKNREARKRDQRRSATRSMSQSRGR